MLKLPLTWFQKLQVHKCHKYEFILQLPNE